LLPIYDIDEFINTRKNALKIFLEPLQGFGIELNNSFGKLFFLKNLYNSNIIIKL